MINRNIEKWYTSKQVTEVTTIIGNTGYGKTYSAGKIQEIYLDNKWPFAIIDKMGIHYVIRAEYDNIVIIGGDHGDYEVEQADEVLPILMDSETPWLLDLSEYTDLDAQEIVTDLFEWLFEWHRDNRRPRNYMVEECDIFLGQTGANARCKAMLTKCITKGRMNGFGFTLLSQRYRMIDKTPLGQTRNYVIFNMKLPIDLSTLAKLVGEDVSSKVRRLPIGKCLVMTDEGHASYAVGTKKSPDVAMTPEVGMVLKDVKIKPLLKVIRDQLEG